MYFVNYIADQLLARFVSAKESAHWNDGNYHDTLLRINEFNFRTFSESVFIPDI